MSEIKLNHIALVVADIDAAMAFWRDCFNLEVSCPPHPNADEAVEMAFLRLGDSRLELISPTDEKSGVARFLAARGPGLHHICLEVEDLDDQLQRLRDRGIELINETAREAEGRRYAFVHPRSAFGALLELYERT